MIRGCALALAVLAASACNKRDEVPEPVVEPAKQVEDRSLPPPPPIASPRDRTLPRPEDLPMPDRSGPDPWLDGRKRSGDDVFEIEDLPTPGPDATVEELVRDVRKVATATAPELVTSKIVSSYVRKDGVLDPTYGTLEIELQLVAGIDGVIDDPRRPTGAPVPEVAPVEKLRDRCPRLALEKAAWSARSTGCRKLKLAGGPRCTVAQIWSRAIAQGAPDDAVAIVQFDARTAIWTFRITDKLRKVNVSRRYDDDCPAARRP